MANIDAPFGLKPVSTISGAPWNGATRRCYVSASAGALGIGDAVIWNGAGSTAYPEVNEITAGTDNSVFGVIVSLEADPTNLERLYITTDGTGWVNVCVDPHVIYEIQADGVVGAADIGRNAPLILTHTIDTTTGLSQTEMNSTNSADSGDQLLIVGAPDRADNDTTLTHANWYVLINEHSFLAPENALGV